jgi:hypothetical protein
MEGKGQLSTKRLKSVNHNKTKLQHEKLSHQLLDRVQEWFWKSRDLLSAPGHGIPAVAEINKNGWRRQDKANLRTDMAAENAKVASSTRAKISVNMVIEVAQKTPLSNDRVFCGYEITDWSNEFTYMSCKDENDCMQIDNGPIDDVDSKNNSGELLIGNINDEDKKINMHNHNIVWMISQSMSGIRKSYGMPNNHHVVDYKIVFF